MKPPIILAFVVLAAVVAAEAFLIRRQELRLRELEAQLARQGTPEGAAELLRRAGMEGGSAGGEAEGSPAVRAAVEKEVASRTSALEERLASLEHAAAAGAGGAAAGGGASPEDLDAVVAKKVDEKLGEKKKGGIFGDDNKRPLTEISKDLALTELQEDQLEQAIEASQKLVFELITTPRNDGTNLLDDVVEAMKDPEHAEEKVKAAFMQLFTAKLPGSEETYLGKIMAEKQALNGEFGKILTPDQMKKWDRLGQDPHEIQTGYDPYGEYIVERLGQK